MSPTPHLGDGWQLVEDDMGKPSKGTPKDMRLKANKTTAAPKAGAPKFGSPAWQAKYGKKPKA